MAFPVVESVTATSFNTETTSHAVPMPATVAAGDLLIIFFGSDDDNGTAAGLINNPSGWTQLANGANHTSASSNWVHELVTYKIADGSEGGTTVDVTTDAAESGAAQVYRISGWHGTTPPEISVRAGSGTGTGDPTPPSVTASWGAEDNLFITSAAHDNELRSVNAYPANYTNGVHTLAAGQSAGAGAALASARRQLAAASNDPGIFDLSTNEQWVSFTVVIRPGEASSPQSVSPAALASASSLGAVTIHASIDIPLSALASAAQIGSPTPLPGGVNVGIAALSSAADFGDSVAVPGPVSVTLVALESVAALGVPDIGMIVVVNGLDSAADFGTPTASQGGTLVPVSALVSAADFGDPETIPGTAVVVVSALDSASQFGTATAGSNVTALISALASSSAFGVPVILVGNVIIPVSGLESFSQFGATGYEGGTGPSFNSAVHGGTHRR